MFCTVKIPICRKKQKVVEVPKFNKWQKKRERDVEQTSKPPNIYFGFKISWSAERTALHQELVTRFKKLLLRGVTKLEYLSK
jgi:hypothetical protein